jgi:hypothetical protein
MKRVVFLLLLITSLLPQTIIAQSVRVFTFPTYELQLTRIRVDDALGYDMEKIGENPFSKRLIYPNCELTINDIIDVNGTIYLYGYIHCAENMKSYYDGLIIQMDTYGNETAKIILEQEKEEDIKQISDVGPYLFVHLRSAQINEREEYDFLKDEIIALDTNLLEQKRYPFYNEINNISSNQYMLLIDIDGDNIFDNGIKPDLTLISKNDFPLEKNEPVFTGSIYIPFLNEALLNNTPVANGVFIDQPGYYELLWNEQQFSFTVDPIIEGVEDGAVYSSPIRPKVSSGSLMLDTKRFISGQLIDRPGNYRLLINGVEGYIKTLQFTITSNMQGIVNNGKYTDEVQITFNGDGYLNNGYVTSPLIISEKGEYLLQVKGEGGYSEQYAFTIEQDLESLTFASFLRDYDLIIFGITLISGFIVLKKK